MHWTLGKAARWNLGKRGFAQGRACFDSVEVVELESLRKLAGLRLIQGYCGKHDELDCLVAGAFEASSHIGQHDAVEGQ